MDKILCRAVNGYYAKVSGYLEAIYVDIGDRVTKDQVLVEIWVPELDAELRQKEAMLEQAEAARRQAETALKVAEAHVATAEARLEVSKAGVQRAEADLAYWRVELNRTQRLVSRAAEAHSILDEVRSKFLQAEATVSESQARLRSDEATLDESRAHLDKARADLAVAVSDVEVARSDLERSRTLVNYTQIRAPYDGLITRRNAHSGTFIQSAADSGQAMPLVTLMRLDRKRIVVDIPESEAGWVRIGQPATFRYNSLGKRTMAGRVVRIADALEPGTRTMRIEIVVDDPEEIRPGIYGQATIVLADYPEALVLPSTAVLHNGEAPAVMVVEAGRARLREVEVGLDDGVRAQIRAGLDDAEPVILEGNTAVRDGQPVEVAS